MVENAQHEAAVMLNNPKPIAPLLNSQGRVAEPVNPLADPMSPFFLHPSESPGQVLVSTPLTEQNYNFWSQTMIMAFDSKNKMGFLDGSVQEPALGDPLRSVWERKNTFIRAWIIRSLSNEIAQSVMFVKKAFNLWSELRQRFSQGNHCRLADLQEELYALKQGNLSVTSFFTQLKKLWGEIENYRPIDPCACGLQCVCKEYREQDCVMRFLKGLNYISIFWCEITDSPHGSSPFYQSGFQPHYTTREATDE